MPQATNNKADVFQINLHKATAPTAELNDLLSKHSSFISLIQEPLYRHGKIQGLNRRRGNIIHYAGKNSPRTCIYISKDWNVHPLYHLCSRDLAVACIKAKKCGNDLEIVICSAYFPYDSVDDPPTQEYVNLVNYCNTNSIPLVSSIDANAHHLAWGSTNSNARGNNLLEFILSSNIMINNIGFKPTFVVSNRSEVLDITLTTPNIFSFITEWRVTESILTSDHRCIQFCIDLDPLPRLLFRNPASTNWEIFINRINNSTSLNVCESNLTNTAELDLAADLLHKIIIDSYEAACPLRKHKAGHSLPYYATEDRKLRKKFAKLLTMHARRGIQVHGMTFIEPKDYTRRH